MQNKLLLLLTSDFEKLNLSLQSEVYDEFYNFVYRTLLYILKDHGVVEDVIQESFLKAINNAPQLENEQKLYAWIKVITRNTAFNYYNKTKRNRNELESDTVYVIEDINTHGNQSLEREVEAKIMEESIYSYLDDMKPDYRHVIESRWKHGLTYKEIAAATNMSEDNVRQKIHRARKSIKKKFLKDWGNPDEKG